MSQPDFDQIRASLQSLDDVQARHAAAFNAAQGVYADDPVSPSVMALVWQGKLADLQIADPVCALPPRVAADLINAVVINAFNAWQSDMNQLMQASAESV